MTYRDVEKLISWSKFPNPDHKRKLHERLFGETRELSLDELNAAAGGYAPHESELRESAFTKCAAPKNTLERQENSGIGWIEWPVSEDIPE